MKHNGLSPTQKAIFNVLVDGKRHTREELHKCLPDSMSQLSAIQRHISVIRSHLRSEGGQDIICQQIAGQIFYKYLKAT